MLVMISRRPAGHHSEFGPWTLPLPPRHIVKVQVRITGIELLLVMTRRCFTREFRYGVL
jgi:hypothetical protein